MMIFHPCGAPSLAADDQFCRMGHLQPTSDKEGKRQCSRLLGADPGKSRGGSG